jgi:putative hydrolase of the HAD superfamily
MGKIKVVSFDAEGTLVTPDFSQVVWHEQIPTLYAQDRDITIEQAKEIVRGEYDLRGEHRMEWYDIKFWFDRFGLEGYDNLLYSQRHTISVYPEVSKVLQALKQKYELIIISNSSMEFLDLLLEGISDNFSRVFSSISHYRTLKTADFYLDVCGDMGIEPEEMAHVGDLWNPDLVIPSNVGINAFYLDRNREKQGNEVVYDLLHFQVKLQDHQSL